ncbi:hypothetical protein [Francisella sp. SYW-9]|uniref:hypothetical protein n=1 Tax=Francisella sp. SYW-9 TaxID=2610888 RepID=UPI00123D6D7A|nr:hypothetical protein [Francisella sp. SYW-9]
MKLCIIRNNYDFEIVTKYDLFKKLGITEITLYEDDLKDFDHIKNLLSMNDPKITNFEELFEELAVDDSLVHIAQEICDYGYWVAENNGYNSVCYDSLKILKHNKYVGCSEHQSDEWFSFIDGEFTRYIIKNNIDSITGIFIDASCY